MVEEGAGGAVGEAIVQRVIGGLFVVDWFWVDVNENLLEVLRSG
jgi:hypothetical protein